MFGNSVSKIVAGGGRPGTRGRQQGRTERPQTHDTSVWRRQGRRRGHGATPDETNDGGPRGIVRQPLHSVARPVPGSAACWPRRDAPAPIRDVSHPHLPPGPQREAGEFLPDETGGQGRRRRVATLSGTVPPAEAARGLPPERSAAALMAVQHRAVRWPTTRPWPRHRHSNTPPLGTPRHMPCRRAVAVGGGRRWHADTTATARHPCEGSSAMSPRAAGRPSVHALFGEGHLSVGEGAWPHRFWFGRLAELRCAPASPARCVPRAPGRPASASRSGLSAVAAANLEGMYCAVPCRTREGQHDRVGRHASLGRDGAGIVAVAAASKRSPAGRSSGEPRDEGVDVHVHDGQCCDLSHYRYARGLAPRDPSPANGGPRRPPCVCPTNGSSEEQPLRLSPRRARLVRQPLHVLRTVLRVCHWWARGGPVASGPVAYDKPPHPGTPAA